MYSKVYLALTQLLPEEVDSRLTNMAFLMIGILGAHSVLTGRLAAHIPVHVKKPSLVRRMERFLDNGAVRVRTWYEPIARWLIQAASEELPPTVRTPPGKHDALTVGRGHGRDARASYGFRAQVDAKAHQRSLLCLLRTPRRPQGNARSHRQHRSRHHRKFRRGTGFSLSESAVLQLPSFYPDVHAE
jgi:hypothetical protein